MKIAWEVLHFSENSICFFLISRDFLEFSLFFVDLGRLLGRLLGGFCTSDWRWIFEVQKKEVTEAKEQSSTRTAEGA